MPLPSRHNVSLVNPQKSRFRAKKPESPSRRQKDLNKGAKQRRVRREYLFIQTKSSPTRQTQLKMTGRSVSPSRRGRSSSPSAARGRSSSPSRARGRSSSPSRMRGRSNSPSRMRGRSNSPSKMRGRSNSPSRMRGRSNSPSRARGRSNSPSRANGRGKSSSPSGGKRRGFRRGGRRPGGEDGKRFGLSRDSRLGRSMRRMAPPETCGMGRVLSYLIPIVLLLASSAGLVVVTGNTPDVLKNLVPSLKNEDIVDPFDSSKGGISQQTWNNGGGGGLELDILNALSSNWEIFFSLAVADWDFGNPDALTLRTEKIAIEQECKPVVGKVKVCNGDYGDVKWRGINVATYDDSGFINSGAARVNEYYLLLDSEDAKQYTMCHEIGHAFGLLHTDQTFGNEDLGNCLDYTNNFDVNKHPDVSNYEALLTMYGPVGGRRLRGDVASSAARELSADAWHEIHEAVEKLLERRDDNAHEDGWKLLHRTEHGEEHHLTFEGGHSVRVHMLLA